jgi:hypothetical protein
MTGSDMAVRSAGTLDSKIKYAQALASASLLPRTYLNQPANVLLAIELGESLGISSIQAINGIHVIEGKPSASADLIASLVRRAGHKLRVSVDDKNLVAVAQIIRSDDPDFTYESRWDMDKARVAGLAGKGTWKNHPGQMLRNRAITEVARMGASDALYGVIYTPEELGADTNEDGDPVVTQIAAAPEPEPDVRTAAQATKLAILIRENELERDEALSWMSGLVGHDIGSTKELTKAEASKVIDALESAKAAGADVQTGEVVEAELVLTPEQSEDALWPEVAAVAK